VISKIVHVAGLPEFAHAGVHDRVSGLSTLPRVDILGVALPFEGPETRLETAPPEAAANRTNCNAQENSRQASSLRKISSDASQLTIWRAASHACRQQAAGEISPKTR
jgi:hypothetical protein